MKSQRDAATANNIDNMFQRLKNYTVLAMTMQCEDNSNDHNYLADFISEYHIVPVGSFALECMRNTELVIDVLFIFREGSLKINTFITFSKGNFRNGSFEIISTFP